MDCGCGQCKKKDEQCMHSYADHLKRLQGGDFQNSSLRDEKITLKSLPGNEISAFLDIGAEAERRNDILVNEMKCTLQKYILENESLRQEYSRKTEQLKELQRKVIENEKIIMTLTIENDEMDREIQQNTALKCQIDQLNLEKESLNQENEDLKSQITEINWKLTELQETHKMCGANEDLPCKDEEICALTIKLEEAEKKIQHNYSIIATLKEENYILEGEVSRLTQQWKSQTEQFSDKSASYQKTIADLKEDIRCLEKELYYADEGNTRGKLYSENIAERLPKVNETYVSKQICEQDRIRQQLINKIDQRDKNIQELTKIQFANESVTLEDYNDLARIIEKQAYEITQLTHELQSKSLEDSESVDLLNEIAQLQYAVYDSAGECYDEVCALLRRIKRIQCRIKSRLQREEARRKEISRQLGIYRCQFIHVQKEIEEMRQSNINSRKDDIKARVEQEKILSHYISQANKQKKELNSKCESLKKALTNIQKVNEFVEHLV